MRDRVTVERELEQRRGELAQGLNEFKTLADDQKPGKAEELKRLDEACSALHDEWAAARGIEDMEAKNAEQLEALKSRRGVDRRVPHQAGEFKTGAEPEVETDSTDTVQPPAGFKSLGESFVRSEAFKANRGSTAPRYQVEIPGATISNIKAVITPYALPTADVVPFARRRATVADLMPQSNTDQAAIIYLEQTTSTNNAAAVAEGALKPTSVLGYTRRTQGMEVIAHLHPLTTQELEYIPGVRDIIDQEMVELLRLAEEVQILSGNGSTPNIQGIQTKSGVQTQAKGIDDIFTAAMKAFTLIRHTGFADVTAGVMHPNDWLVYATAQDDLGRFLYGSPFDNVQPRLWGVPIVVTTAATENTALFGDFQMYVRLWRKGGIRIEVGHNADDFSKNLQTLRVEEFVTLQIRRPSAFALLTGV